MTSRGGAEDNTRDRHGFDPARVLHRLAVTASRARGFGAVTVNLRTPEGDYAVVADTDGELLGTRSFDEFWTSLIGDGYRVGISYIVPPEHVRRTLEAYPEVCSVAPELPPATGPDDWDPDHMLVVPMLSRVGENVGYFSVDCPPNGRIPGPELVADMETFAEHAALTVELAAEAEALRSSEEKLRVLTAQLPAHLWTTDADLRITSVEGTALTPTGIETDRYVGKDLRDLAAGAGAGPEPVAAHLRALDGGVGSYQIAVAGRVFDARVEPLRDRTGRVSGCVGLAVDVTERREAEGALRQSEERFRALVRNSTDVIAVLDAEGITRYVSPAVERVLGYTPDERVGTSVLAAGLVHPEDEDRVRRAFDEVVAGPDAELRVQFRLRHRDGSWRYAEAVGRNLLGDPSVGGVVVNYRDATERRRAEERTAAFSNLAHGLNSATTAVDAARIIARVADGLLGWDAYALLLRSSDDDQLIPTLDFDIVEGRRTESASGLPIPPGSLSRRAMEDGPQLLLRERPSLDLEGLQPFGDRSRPSASLMFAPIRSGGGAVGVLTVQSYSPDAYTEADLVTLQALADHCGGALERIGAEEALHRSARDYRSLFELANDAILILEPEGEVVLDVNERACGLYGIPRERFIGTSIKGLSRDVGRWEEHLRLLLAQGRYDGFETVQYRADATPIDLLINASVIEFRGRRAVLSINRDITERKALEEQLRHRALHDPLTGLPNRALFLDRLGHAMERTATRRSVVSVLYLDVDRLTGVNDSLGHDVGDALLVGIGERLRGSVRPEDTVARLSGDEFAVLIEEIGDPGEAVPIAERILAQLGAPFVVSDREVVATASIGIAVGGSAETTPAAVLQAADVAMYRAKAGGGSRYVVYGTDMASLALQRLELESELLRAIDREEFEVYYQPKVDMETGRIAEVEALVRWQHPRLGVVPPADFIPLAEETGLIVPIGRWVLEQACRRVREWRDRYPSDPPLRAGVNLSAREFGHPEIVGEIARTLREAGLDAGGLELEITESAVMTDTEAVAATLKELEALGVYLAIDDFGTGYSSLAHLKRFPISTLKIDRAFVAGLDRDPEDTAIVGAVLGLGRALGLRVVAEGVETAEHVATLRALGCVLAQGNHLSKPLPAEEMEALLSEGRHLAV